eukprot:TRINITY_DN44655_c0_g1_i1.p1 TRINITY_DN44655_c0_g1~~TRINITY_DN44655_c0_g1_i1.p1  ORF type:complete len:452 (+),score=84.16 TRINITY_DN44655_c0_g1_i1:91-1356(+)
MGADGGSQSTPTVGSGEAKPAVQRVSHPAVPGLQLGAAKRDPEAASIAPSAAAKAAQSMARMMLGRQQQQPSGIRSPISAPGLGPPGAFYDAGSMATGAQSMWFTGSVAPSATAGEKSAATVLFSYNDSAECLFESIRSEYAAGGALTSAVWAGGVWFATLQSSASGQRGRTFITGTPKSWYKEAQADHANGYDVSLCRYGGGRWLGATAAVPRGWRGEPLVELGSEEFMRTVQRMYRQGCDLDTAACGIVRTEHGDNLAWIGSTRQLPAAQRGMAWGAPGLAEFAQKAQEQCNNGYDLHLVEAGPGAVIGATRALPPDRHGHVKLSPDIDSFWRWVLHEYKRGRDLQVLLHHENQWFGATRKLDSGVHGSAFLRDNLDEFAREALRLSDRGSYLYLAVRAGTTWIGATRRIAGAGSGRRR